MTQDRLRNRLRTAIMVLEMAATVKTASAIGSVAAVLVVIGTLTIVNTIGPTSMTNMTSTQRRMDHDPKPIDTAAIRSPLEVSLSRRRSFDSSVNTHTLMLFNEILSNNPHERENF